MSASPLPPGADAVAPLDAVRGAGQSAPRRLEPVAPGDGVLAAGADAMPRAPLRRSGERVRNVDVAVFGRGRRYQK